MMKTGEELLRIVRDRMWEKRLREPAQLKSTLRYLNLEQATLSKPHIIWEAAISSDTRALQRAITKAKFATGTYNLHGRRVHYATPDLQPNCKLCASALETREHVLVHCPAYTSVRAKFWTKAGVGAVPDISTILDHTNSAEPDVKMEELTQMYCQTIHCHRLLALNSLA
jgi:hypothetical protein